MTQFDLEQQVLRHVNGKDYKPVKPKTIAKKLGVPKDHFPNVRKAIKRLAKQGKLAYGENHLVMQVGAQASGGEKRVTGTFRRTNSGFGFVRPTGTLPSVGRDQDIYIPEKKSGDASRGDLVVVRLTSRRGPKGKLAGEIVDVVERETHRFVGTYVERAGMGTVGVDGSVFGDPIYVGDAGAKGAKDGDKVVIEMVRFPSHSHEGEGVIVEVLGPRGKPGVDTLSIIHEYNLPQDFPDDVLADAREAADTFEPEATSDRIDLTGETIITIDPKDARDFDDAISLERIENDHWRLGVHIADVSHFVRPGTRLDAEARARGTSVYLPDRVIPMLPEAISNNLASLQPHRPRYAMTASIEFTPDGARVGMEPCLSVIDSKHRFTYEEVDDYLARPTAWLNKLTPEVHALLGRMHELAMILRGRRRERGSLELALPKVKIDLDGNGKVAGAHLEEYTESHQIIEEFMLAANEAVAEMFDDRDLFFLRRMHAQPDPRKLRQLTEFVHDLGIDCESLEDRFEIQRVLDQVAGQPAEYAVNFAVLRSMQKAVYGPEEIGHYALASKHYCHFTSPIRRYPDLTVHRQLAAIVRGQKPGGDYEELVALGAQCSDREQRAEAAERELIKVKLLTYMKGRIGSQMDAIITGVESFGIFAQGIQIPAEGLIHVNALQDDYYEHDARSHSLNGRRKGNSFRLGDALRVEVAHVDIDRRELDLRVVSRLERAPKFKSQPKKKKSSRKKKATRNAARQEKPAASSDKGATARRKPAKKKTAAKKTTRKKSKAGKRKKS